MPPGSITLSMLADGAIPLADLVRARAKREERARAGWSLPQDLDGGVQPPSPTWAPSELIHSTPSSTRAAILAAWRIA